MLDLLVRALSNPLRVIQMNAITTTQLYDLFVDTAKRCSSRIVSLSDAEIEYNVFEEFDVGVRSFFHEDAIARLATAGMLSEVAVPVCQRIQRKWIELDKSDWTIADIKNHPDWNYLFSECDKLLNLLDQQD